MAAGLRVRLALGTAAAAGGLLLADLPAPVRPALAAVLWLCLLLAARLAGRAAGPLEVQLFPDPLTGLPTRTQLLQDMRRWIAEQPDRPFTLVLVRLDGLRTVNDGLGHPAGDQLLVGLTGRLVEQTGPEDAAYRFAGHEFAAVLADTDHHGPPGRVRLLHERLAAALVLTLPGGEVSVHAHPLTGTAHYPAHADTAEAVLRCAEIAVGEARRGPQVACYRPTFERHTRARIELEDQLRAAVRTGAGLVLHYQPKIRLATGRCEGVEALLRWQHPERGLLPPAEFLPLAEEAGLMGAVTGHVLEQAVAQLAAWREQGLVSSVAVNLSASSLLDAQLPDRVVACLHRHGVPGEGLVVEITEAVLTADPELARGLLGRLRAAGVRVSVDDYGTGYSSLSYLRDFDLDELKLDRSFVAGSDTNPRDAAIVRHTVELAHSLAISVVAEGIETASVLATTVGMGCDVAQGFLLSPPLPAAALAEWLGRTAALRSEH